MVYGRLSVESQWQYFATAALWLNASSGVCAHAGWGWLVWLAWSGVTGMHCISLAQSLGVWGLGHKSYRQNDMPTGSRFVLVHENSPVRVLTKY